MVHVTDNLYAEAKNSARRIYDRPVGMTGLPRSRLSCLAPACQQQEL